MSDREAILAADDAETVVVPVPEWGVELTLRSPSGTQRGRLAKLFEAVQQDDGDVDYGTVYSALIIATAVDAETGDPVFTADDAAALAKKNGAVLDRLATKALEVAGLDADATDRLGKADS